MPIENITQDATVVDSGSGTLEKPKFLGIQITSRCNLQCPNCLQGNPKKKLPDLRPASLRKILDLNIFSSLKRVAMVGGEVFLSPHFFSLVSLLEKRGLSLESFATNGILLHRYIPKIKDARISYINISLDAASEEEYQMTRGGEKGGFHRIRKSLEQLALSCGDSKIIAVSILTHMKNISKLSNYIKKFWNWPIHRLTFISMVSWPGATTDTEKSMLLFDTPDLRRILQSVKETITPTFILDLPDLISDEKYRYCPLPFMNVTMDASGNASPCGWKQPDGTFGNYFKDGDSAWMNKSMMQWRRGILYGGEFFSRKCRLCPYRGIQGFSYDPEKRRWFQRKKACA
jgi:MoaA/NifB/PqqE/SkfB family radical SAM enzyme